MSGKPHHGEAKRGERTRLYETWRGMRQRCNNPKASFYSIYGGAGVTVCEDWDIFINFRDWALNSGYTDNLYIERKEPTDGYNPNNCYWTNMSVQQSNKRKRLGTKSSFIGVTTNKKRWSAYVHYKGVHNHLGTFDTPEEAA